ncbi:hypothetical protein PUN28_019827 [Cardiocondyla obscurior]|uniref:Uncharacterized protein n=1 Tax=Cardiocondyla obscurior TaxID=286306 RepID=A0AAW2E7N5_9HYME
MSLFAYYNFLTYKRNWCTLDNLNPDVACRACDPRLRNEKNNVLIFIFKLAFLNNFNCVTREKKKTNIPLLTRTSFLQGRISLQWKTSTHIRIKN